MQKGDFGAEGREGAALFAWEMGARGGEGAGAVPLGEWCVLDKKVCWSNDLGGSSAPQLVNLAVHSLCELSLYQNKITPKFSCEHEIWVFFYFGTALSEDKVLFIPQ